MKKIIFVILIISGSLFAQDKKSMDYDDTVVQGIYTLAYIKGISDAIDYYGEHKTFREMKIDSLIKANIGDYWFDLIIKWKEYKKGKKI